VNKHRAPLDEPAAAPPHWSVWDSLALTLLAGSALFALDSLTRAINGNTAARIEAKTLLASVLDTLRTLQAPPAPDCSGPAGS